MAFTPEQHRAYRKKLTKQGICSRCRKRKADKNFVTCKPCRDMIKVREDRLISEGRCKQCGCFSHGYIVCPMCEDVKHRSRVLLRSL